MIFFLIRSGFCLLCFFAFYKWKLEGERMFHFNRFYLVAGLVASIFIPLITIDHLVYDISNSDTLESIEYVLNGSTSPLAKSNNLNLSWMVLVIYISGAVILLIRICLNIANITNQVKSSESLPFKDSTLVLLEEPILPFAFLNYIFINRRVFEKQEIDNVLLIHELAHVQQKHTYDIIFIEILKALFWFNPLLYLYKNAIKLNHEFLADAHVLEQDIGVVEYQKLLLKRSSKNSNVLYHLSSTFHFELTKKRLKMMTKKTSVFQFSKNIFYATFTLVLCIFFFNKPASAQQGEGTKSELKEYIDLLSDKIDVDGNLGQIKMSEAERMSKLYGKFSVAQRKELRALNIPAPPPPPPPLPPQAPPNPPLAPPPPPPFPAKGKYFIDGKESTVKEANELIRSGKEIKIKRNKDVFHIKTNAQ